MSPNFTYNSSRGIVFPKVSIREYPNGVLTIETLVRIQRGNYWLVPVSHSAMIGGFSELRKKEIESHMLLHLMQEAYKVQFLYIVQTKTFLNSRNEDFRPQYEDENQESEVERLKNSN